MRHRGRRHYPSLRDEIMTCIVDTANHGARGCVGRGAKYDDAHLTWRLVSPDGDSTT